MKRSGHGGILVGLLIAANATAHAAEPALGRLFFSDEERVALDAARHAAATPPPQIREDEVPHLPEAALEMTTIPSPAPVTLNGIVSRSAGPATVWVNGSAQDARHLSLPAGTTARVARDALEVGFGAAAPARRLKAGQTYDPAEPAIREAHDGVSAAPDAPGAP